MPRAPRVEPGHALVDPVQGEPGAGGEAGGVQEPDDVPGEEDPEAPAHQQPLLAGERRAIEVGVGGHHPPGLPGIVPGEVAAGDHEQHRDQCRRILALVDRDADIEQQDQGDPDRRPLVAEDHLLRPVDHPVRGEEMGHVDERREGRLRSRADQDQVVPAAQEQGDEGEERQAAHRQGVDGGRNDGGPAGTRHGGRSDGHWRPGSSTDSFQRHSNTMRSEMRGMFSRVLLGGLALLGAGTTVAPLAAQDSPPPRGSTSLPARWWPGVREQRCPSRTARGLEAGRIPAWPGRSRPEWQAVPRGGGDFQLYWRPSRHPARRRSAETQDEIQRRLPPGRGGVLSGGGLLPRCRGSGSSSAAGAGRWPTSSVIRALRPVSIAGYHLTFGEAFSLSAGGCSSGTRT